MSSLILPINIQYRDEVELIHNLLEIYSVTMKLQDKNKKLTNRNIDLLALCILYGINNKEIRKIGVDSGIFNSAEQMNTEFSRLKRKGLIQKHPVENRRFLSGGIEFIEQLINNRNKNVSLLLNYER